MKTAFKKSVSFTAATMVLGLLANCSQGDFASNNGQPPADAKKTKAKSEVNSEDPSNPFAKLDPNSPTTPVATDIPLPNQDNKLAVDSGGRLALTDVYSGVITYQGNQCPGGGACGNEAIQIAVDGLDFRNLSLTTTLKPAAVAPIASKYIGKTVLTGLGSSAAWGGRSVKFKAAGAVIYNANDVTIANSCPADRVPIGKPKVAHTSNMGQFICAKLDPRISLGANVTIAQKAWNYSVTGECPAGHIVTGANFGGVIGGPWSIICAPLNVK